MKFNTYLKSCREHNTLTQEELVHQLYSYDIDLFEGLDTSTLSKWERGVTHPKAAKQVSIIKYFQKMSGLALPCWDGYSVQEAEDLICQIGVQNLLGRSKKLVLCFPSKLMQLDDLKVYPVRHAQRMETLLDLNMDIHFETTHPYAQISLDQFRTWALHPSNLFLACEYKNGFLGLFFSIRLKPEIFEKIMSFEMKKSDITIDDFATFDEMGSNFMLSFFALNEKAAIMLGIRYYAHLIANQTRIKEIGAITILNEVKKLVHNMNLEKYQSKISDDTVELESYRQTLSNVLVSENAVKMLFSKYDQTPV
jgi:transcriptional regulator with XRE-family HTH domain